MLWNIGEIATWNAELMKKIWGTRNRLHRMLSVRFEDFVLDLQDLGRAVPSRRAILWGSSHWNLITAKNELKLIFCEPGVPWPGICYHNSVEVTDGGRPHHVRFSLKTSLNLQIERVSHLISKQLAQKRAEKLKFTFIRLPEATPG